MADQIDSASKDTHTWVTGDEDATAPQKSYLETLGRQTGEHVDVDELTKAEASDKIEELQERRAVVAPQEHDSPDIAADTDPDLSDDDQN